MGTKFILRTFCSIRDFRGSTYFPWFPRHVSELDQVSNNVLMYGKDLDANHPGIKDKEYRKRRESLANIAYNYRYGQTIPRVEYTETEKETWGFIYRELKKLYGTHACRQHQENLRVLEKHAGYKESDLPQLEDVSKFLKGRSGFTVRPVAGYMSPRDFLSGLAFRVFYCTQYVRHPKDPAYSPEPDCCHELLGHMPLLADPAFAQLTQEIGLASLGTEDTELKRIAAYALSQKAKILPFVPMEVAKEECLVTTFQGRYFETPTVEDAAKKMLEFVKTVDRPFDVKYDPLTESVRVVDKLGGTATDYFNPEKAAKSTTGR